VLSVSINEEKVGKIVQKEVYEIIKEELRNKLKVKTTIQFPQTFNNGYLKTEVIYDDEVIHENVQTIKTGSTMFSF
jgi:hypothetical protein